MSAALGQRDWADDLDDDAGTIAAPSLPAPEVINNKDGTKTVISFRINDEGKKAKVTRRIRTTVMREQVNPRVAERRTWKKYGLEEGRAAGPALETTSLAENIVFRPNVRWKEIAEKEAEESANAGGATEEKKEKVFRCRICTGEHFTARCPLKGSMAPIEDVASPAHPPPEVQPPSGLGGRSGYVPPHLRNRPAGAGPPERPGRHDRDDLATLRVTNLSESAEEDELREMFSRFGRVIRVFVSRDRETNLAKGFAFISFADRESAARALERLDGHGYRHLIMRVETAKKSS